MQLWQLDIPFAPMLVDVGTGELRQARIVTGLDDDSRYRVSKATGRAVCLAVSEALERYGAPEEVLTDETQKARRSGPPVPSSRCCWPAEAGQQSLQFASC